MVASTRSIVLERRPDLPLYGLRTVRHLRAGKSNDHDIRLLLSTSTGRHQKTRDTESLLQTPTKCCSSQGMPRRDRIAIGKAIVNRPRRDDHWVTTDTAPLSFAAATKEFPANNKCFKAQAKAESGLIGNRELALLESYYRLAAAECRAENPPRTSTADPGGDRRYRRPKANNEGGCSTNRAPPHEPNDEAICTTETLGERFDEEGVSAHGSVSGSGYKGYKGREAGATTRLRQSPDRGKAKSSRPCPSSRSPLRGRVSPNASRPQEKIRKDLFNGISHSRAVAEDAGDARAGEWTPDTMFYVGRSGVSGRGKIGGEEEDSAGGVGQGSQNVALHRGLVITEELRKEILNPLAQRFKLLRRAH
ncbi:hypothetical protein Esi_0130_0034 [Ectocarpus siliculosus]|uniref:Uncharacterized protein n=1 Tax=Ectocarpus siliculosus TaxID=2880 RepID=D7FJ96_ECTSI|nr:hypothetical protein Esi_0130_0034 [Ectocarpus siliculosus]|eukprot:CBJ29002.1 hypothetical protein Esi_0130_0034 [Ectocarpus siliculosus]